jgi:hypothetical protein
MSFSQLAKVATEELPSYALLPWALILAGILSRDLGGALLLPVPSLFLPAFGDGRQPDLIFYATGAFEFQVVEVVGTVTWLFFPVSCSGSSAVCRWQAVSSGNLHQLLSIGAQF